jgi:hypothetical protein
MARRLTIGAQLARLRWANATDADREKSRKNGRLGGRPVCVCKECKACLKRAKAAPGARG